METSGHTASRDRFFRWFGAAFSLAGVVIMAYLTHVHFAPEGSSVCDLSGTLNCSIVNKSVFSELMGLPLSVMGAAYFIAMFWAFIAPRVSRRYAIIIAATTFSLVFGLYLSAIEQFWLGTVCVFCETSKVIMVALLVTAVLAARRAGERVPALWVLAGIGAGAALSAVSHLLQS